MLSMDRYSFYVVHKASSGFSNLCVGLSMYTTKWNAAGCAPAINEQQNIIITSQQKHEIQVTIIYKFCSQS